MFVLEGVSVAARGSRILLFRVPLAFLCALIDGDVVLCGPVH